MLRIPKPALLASAAAVWPAIALAHYTILLPEAPAVRPGTTVRLAHSFGHPFEHELEASREPLKVLAHPPEGDPVRLEIERPGDAGKSGGPGKALEHAYAYRVERRGDHVIALEAAPFVDESSGVIVRDHAKVVIHSLTQNGWDRRVGQPLEIVPITRPYGIRPGWTFQAQAFLDGKALEGATVEVERYNAKPGAKAAGDEFVTRSSRTAPGGVLTATLDEAAWWAVTVSVRRGTEIGEDKKERPVLLRSTLWVHVGEPLEAPSRD